MKDDIIWAKESLLRCMIMASYISELEFNDLCQALERAVSTEEENEKRGTQLVIDGLKAWRE